MSENALPDFATVSSLLGDLLGRKVSVSQAPDLSPDQVCAVGVFATDEKSPFAYFACDLPMAAFCASALSLVPATAAKQAIASGKLNATLEENLAEIFNVCSQLFRGAAQHVSFVESVTEPERVAELLAGAAASVDLTSEVAGYGSGRAKLALF